ncbi:MAG: tyrosine-type recombinase/integrase [Hyphomicrobiaceae bacterium]
MAGYLSVLAVEKLKPETKRYEEPDGLQGLYLIVQPSGAKSWAVRYRINRRPRKLTLGPFPRIDPVKARAKAREAFELISMGRDPAAEKRASTTSDGEDRDTFAGVLQTYVQRHTRHHHKTWVENARLLGLKPDPTDEQVLTAIKGGLVHCWGHRALSEIRKRDVIDVLDAIMDRGKGRTANRTLQTLGAFFKWAGASRDLITASPCTGIVPPAVERRRARVLTHDEIRLFWKATEILGHPFGYVAQLMLLTGARRKEVAGMNRAELNLERGAWSLPGERTKNELAYDVFLSKSALAILAKVPRVQGTELLFTGTGITPVSGFSRAKKIIDRLMSEGVPHWQFHDLRRTCASGMADVGVAPHIVEACLNHISGARAGVAGIYNRAEYAAEKKLAWSRWATHIEQIVAGETATNVVPTARS